MAIRTIISDPVAEKSSAKITGQLQDEDGNGIPSSSLSSLKLTLYVAGQPSQIINNRNKQNVLNANGVTIDSQGNLIYIMTPEDNQIIGSSPRERHIALFEWEWSGATKAGRQQILIEVVNLEQVP